MNIYIYIHYKIYHIIFFFFYYFLYYYKQAKEEACTMLDGLKRDNKIFEQRKKQQTKTLF